MLFEKKRVLRVSLEIPSSKKVAALRVVQVFSYFYFFVSALLLLMSLTDPKAKWSESGELFGVTISIDIYGDLFVFCTVLYIPMMAFAFYYFVKALVVSFKSKNLQGGLSSLATAVVGVVALYSFNHWVFSEIY